MLMARSARTPDRAADAGRVHAAIDAARIVIAAVSPCVGDGRFAAKGVIGRPVVVEGDIFIDGHERLAAQLVWCEDGEHDWQAAPMEPLGNDRWRGSFVPSRLGRHRFSIQAWLDRWGSFRDELGKKSAAGADIELEIEEGRQLVAAAGTRATAALRQRADALARSLREADQGAACELLLGGDAAALMAELDERRFFVRLAPELAVEVERAAAEFGSWYELFPRSQTRDADVHGSFDDVIGRLPALRAMGFDVLYLPPIHPIGTTHRKGRNNGRHSAPGDPGSPYAIGAREGGHDAVHPQLGGIEGFRRLRLAAADHGIELALDFAVQCSPDHPWVRQHPGWFAWRPDGTIRHAENPPKKYEDIVNLDFYAEDAKPALWLALRDIVLYWVGEGVRIFRVDNPHTKPLPFWEWLIAEVRGRHADVIFLAEAFTRPAMMYRLGQIGFSQSYTYFTWRNTKRELTDYLTELADGPPKDFYRPHFFVNTPDINPHFLQTSGRPGFLIRAALAATLSGLWGLYSGFELCEAAALPGREEYLDSEKYEIRPRPGRAPGDIVEEITCLNRIRRENPALHSHRGLKFYNAFNDQVLYYGKATADRSNFILAAVSLDPHAAQAAHFEIPLWEFGLPDTAALAVEELMGGGRFTWRGKLQHWWFHPQMPFAIWRVRPAANR